MALRSLRLRDFRCFPALSCPLAGGETLFVGDNAQGKTSILEAICVLLRLQSPRSSTARDFVRFDTGSFGISGEIGGHTLTHTLTDGMRRLTVDGEPVRKSGDYLAASGLVVWMGNGDLELVSGSGDPRRRYLDFLGSQLHPEYRPALSAYEKALRSRNFLLKRDASPAWQEIDAWTRVLADHGQVLGRLRGSTLASLAPHATAAHHAISGSSESLTLTWEPGGEDDLTTHLARLRPDESRRRITLAGPHRDDFAPAIDGLPAARFASEGQQRTIALALKLAQATLLREVRAQAPILLLDDIFGELDPARRNALLAALPTDSQKLITTTHLGWLREHERPAAVYQVVRGTLTPL